MAEKWVRINGHLLEKQVETVWEWEQLREPPYYKLMQCKGSGPLAVDNKGASETIFPLVDFGNHHKSYSNLNRKYRQRLLLPVYNTENEIVPQVTSDITRVGLTQNKSAWGLNPIPTVWPCPHCVVLQAEDTFPALWRGARRLGRATPWEQGAIGTVGCVYT